MYGGTSKPNQATSEFTPKFQVGTLYLESHGLKGGPPNVKAPGHTATFPNSKAATLMDTGHM